MDWGSIYSNRLYLLKQGLNIDRTQALEWSNIEASVKGALEASRQATAVEAGSPYPFLPVALQSELQKSLVRVEACKAILESVDALYAVLSQRQRRLADRVLSPVVTGVLMQSAEEVRRAS